MGSKTKYFHSKNLEYGEIKGRFGAMELYFDQTELKDNSAEVNIDFVFGACEIYVPKSWWVDSRDVSCFAGTCGNNKTAPTEENAPTLRLTGRVKYGSLEVIYV